MIFCDHCRFVVSHDEYCVYEHRDLHTRCLELIRTQRLIIEYGYWCDENGMMKPDEFFATWLNDRSIEVTQKNDDDPRPPLPFPRQ
jgi:hypothetical protein